MLPNFIGIGAPKAGTTWLFLCLNEHPQIFVAERKETNFFDYQTIEGRISEYAEQFAGGPGASAVGEISTRYLTSIRAPERIRSVIPNVRLFVSLRNPIDQVYSHYWHLLRQNFHEWGSVKQDISFEEALEKYEDKVMGSAYYYKHLQRWLQVFDRSQLHIILYDDIRTAPEEVLKSLFDFLDVDTAFVPPSINQTGQAARRGTSPRGPLCGRIHSYLYDKLNRRVYYPLKKAAGLRTAEKIKNTLRVRETMERVFHREGYPPMKAPTRVAMRQRFDEEIRGVEELTGRSLNNWK